MPLNWFSTVIDCHGPETLANSKLKLKGCAMNYLPGMAGRVFPLRRTGLLISLLAVGSGLAGCLTGEDVTTAAASPAVPVSGSANCPAVWPWAYPTTTNDNANKQIVADGAVEALLCSYRVASTPWRLKASRRITGTASDVANYLNELPTELPPDHACLLGGQVTEHAIVFGYPQESSLTVWSNGCGWSSNETSRAGGDIDRITAFWGAAWKD